MSKPPAEGVLSRVFPETFDGQEVDEGVVPRGRLGEEGSADHQSERYVISTSCDVHQSYDCVRCPGYQKTQAHAERHLKIKKLRL